MEKILDVIALSGLNILFTEITAALLAGLSAFLLYEAVSGFLEKRKKVIELTGGGKFDLKRRMMEIVSLTYKSMKKANSGIAAMPRYKTIEKILTQLNMQDRYDKESFIIMEEAYMLAGFAGGLVVFGSPMMAGLTAIGAFLTPGMLMKSRLDKARYAMLKAVPNGLDIISAFIESGMSLPASVIKYAEKGGNVFASELAIALKKMELGRGFSEVMEDMSLRLESREINMVVNAFLQAERSGGSVREIIRSQAEEIRKKHFLVLKQRAHEAPVKMLIPMMLFIFPVIFIILFGPIVLKFMGGM